MTASPPTHRVAFLLFNDCMISHFAGPMAAFEMAGRFDSPSYELFCISRMGGMVLTSSGLNIETRAFAQAMPIDTMFVVGGFGAIEAGRDEEVLDCIRAQAEHGSQVAGISSGAELLARAGLLDGRRATTHWSLQTEFERLYPAVHLLFDKPICRDGQFWTCGSSLGSIEIARRMIEATFGADVARRATRDLIGDRRILAAAGDGDGRSRYEDMLQWARDHLRSPLTIGELAGWCGMTERHFLSDFASQVGETPAKAIERLRIEASTRLIETSDLSLLDIARTVGFRQPERMRRAFIRSFGQSPHAMRMAFAARRVRRAVPTG